MAGLTIKIAADTAGAVAAFNGLAGSSDELAAKIAKANDKLSNINVQNFIQQQALSVAALQATRGEMGAVEASVGAYQRKIESLIKDTLQPESEQVKALQFELENLKTRRIALEASAAAQAQREKEIAQALEEAADAASREAAIAVKSLDAKTKLEKANIRLKSQQDELKNAIKEAVESGLKPESEEVQKLESEYKKLSVSIEHNTAAQTAQEAVVKGAAVGLAAIGTAVAAAGAFALNAAAKVEDMTAAFTPMMGSAAKAANMVKRINKEAVTTPFEIDAISTSVKRLLPAFQGSETQAIAAFRMIGDTAGGNAQKLDTLTSAYTKVMLKGKTSMEELNMISDAGVPIFTELAASMGVTVAELTDMSSKGKITADDLTGAFKKMTSSGGIFFNGMETSAFTFSSLMLGLQESVGLAAAAIGEKLLPHAKAIVEAIGDAVAAFVEWIDTGNNLDDLLSGLAVAIAAASAALVTFIAVSMKAKIVAGLATAIQAVRAALTALAGPAGIAALIMGTLVTVIGAFITKMHEAKVAGERMAKEMATEAAAADDLLAAYQGVNAEKVVDATTTKRLLELYPQLAKVLNTATATGKDWSEAIHTIQLSQAQNKADPFIQKIKDSITGMEEAQKEAVRLKAAYDAMVNGPRSGTDREDAKIGAAEHKWLQAQRAAEDYGKAIDDAQKQANALLEPVSLYVDKMGVVTEIIKQIDDPLQGLVQTQEEATQKAKNLKDAEDPVERIIRQLRERTEEYGKSEKEVGLIQIGRLKATEEQNTRYSKYADIMQKLIDVEALRTKVLSDTQAAESKAGDYAAKLDELHIKTDKLRDDETQLLALQFQRETAALKAVQAENAAKQAALGAMDETTNLALTQEEAATQAALDALRAYYGEQIKLSKEAARVKFEQESVEHYKTLLDDSLKAAGNNMNARMGVLKDGYQLIADLNLENKDLQVQLEEELTTRIQEEAEKQAQAKLASITQSIGYAQQMVDTIQGIQQAQDEADEARREKEKERLTAQNEADNAALIDKYNKEIQVAELTEEQKREIKARYLAERGELEKNYNSQMDALNKKRKSSDLALAVFEKLLAASQAGINSALAFTQALYKSDLPPPFNIILAGTVLAAGLAEQVKIATAPISAETGGQFTVPSGGGGVDRHLYAFNDGEEINVTPRGAYSGGQTRIIVQLDRQTLFDVVNDGIRSGDIVVSTANL